MSVALPRCDFSLWISRNWHLCLYITEFKNIMHSLKEFLSILESTPSARGHLNPLDNLFIHDYTYTHSQQSAVVRAVYIARWTRSICTESNATKRNKAQQPGWLQHQGLHGYPCQYLGQVQHCVQKFHSGPTMANFVFSLNSISGNHNLVKNTPLLQ